jgi:outer membrane protein
LNENLNRSLGFFLTIPIFNNYQVRTGVSRSRIGLENAKLQNQIVREELFQTIQQANADATAALKRYTASQKNVTALEESFRYTEQRFNVGMINSLEYNDAKNRLTAAESEMLQAKYEYVFRIKILDFYLGQPLKI